MWHYSWFRILILILCLILTFLVGVSIKYEDNTYKPPKDWKGDKKIMETELFRTLIVIMKTVLFKILLSIIIAFIICWVLIKK
jgi:uncharacterized membrane protein